MHFGVAIIFCPKKGGSQLQRGWEPLYYWNRHTRPLWSEHKTTARLRTSSSGSALLKQHGSSYFLDGAANTSWNVRSVCSGLQLLTAMVLSDPVCWVDLLFTQLAFGLSIFFAATWITLKIDTDFASVHYDCNELHAWGNVLSLPDPANFRNIEDNFKRGIFCCLVYVNSLPYPDG